MRLDRQTGTLRTEVSGNGSAVRPLLLPDESGLLFVSRDRNKTILEHVDFNSRKRTIIADWLDRPDGGFCAAWRVPLHGLDQRRRRCVVGKRKTVACFSGWTTTRDSVFSVRDLEVPRCSTMANHATGNSTRKVIRWPSYNRGFGDVAFSAMGRVVIQTVSGKTKELGGGFAPSWSSDGSQLTWTSWSDEANTGALHITNGRGYGRTETLPIQGQLLNPSFGPDGKSSSRSPRSQHR